MSQKKVLIVSFAGVIAFIIATAGLSYAFFSATVNTKGDSKTNTVLKAAHIGVQFTDSAELNIQNMVPGDTYTKTFTLTNDGKDPINYKIVLNNVENTFNRKQDIEIKLYEDGGTTPINTSTVFPSQAAQVELTDTLTIATPQTKNYRLTIRYINSEDNQKGDMGSTVSGEIFIAAVED